MNLAVAVVGASRVGKTLFCINFAEYLGARTLCFFEEGPRGRARGAASPAEARRTMMHPGKSLNGVVRTFAVNLAGQRSTRLALVDTASLKEATPLPQRERAKLVLTVQSIQKAAVVLYLVDLSGNDPSRITFDTTAGRRLEEYCLGSGKLFRTVLTKGDLLATGTETPLQYLYPFVREGETAAISAVTRAGFSDLRRFILPQLAPQEA